MTMRIAFRSRHVGFFVTACIMTIASVSVVVGQSPSNAATQAQVTFTKYVAPILQARCQTCHHSGTFAPMSLMTYEETRPYAKAIKAKVVAREMPPWFIDKNVGVKSFSNDVSLTEEEIATIANWVDEGAPQGNPA